MAYTLSDFIRNINQLSKSLEEKEKKKEIGKIINALQTPFSEVIKMINHENIKRGKTKTC